MRWNSRVNETTARSRAPSGIRTHTVQALDLVPLPVGVPVHRASSGSRTPLVIRTRDDCAQHPRLGVRSGSRTHKPEGLSPGGMPVPFTRTWCVERGSNPHAWSGHQVLNLACLPNSTTDACAGLIHPSQRGACPCLALTTICLDRQARKSTGAVAQSLLGCSSDCPLRDGWNRHREFHVLASVSTGGQYMTAPEWTSGESNPELLLARQTCYL